MIERDNVIPMYQQISDFLTEQIIDGKYLKGNKIPTEIELMEQFNVSRTTVRLAVDQLIEKGLVEKKPGKGTFVTSGKYYHPLNEFKSLYRILLDSNIDVETELVDFKEIVLSEKKIYEKLGLNPGQKVLRVTRLYIADGEPIAYAKLYVHPRYISKISYDEAKLHPLYQILEKKVGLRVNLVDFEIFSDKPPYEVYKSLGIDKNDSVLGMERVLYSKKKDSVEYVVAYFRSDRYRFKITLPSNESSSSNFMNEFKVRVRNEQLDRSQG